MKNTKTNGKRRTPAKDAVSREAAKAVDERISEMVGPNEERWWTLYYAVLARHLDEAASADSRLAAATGVSPGRAQLLWMLGAWIAARRLSTAQLFELGSSEEAMQLCTEALARGIREPAGDGEVIQFPRGGRCWIGDLRPAEEPPEEEGDETFAPGMEEMVGLA